MPSGGCPALGNAWRVGTKPRVSCGEPRCCRARVKQASINCSRALSVGKLIEFSTPSTFDSLASARFPFAYIPMTSRSRGSFLLVVKSTQVHKLICDIRFTIYALSMPGRFLLRKQLWPRFHWPLSSGSSGARPSPDYFPPIVPSRITDSSHSSSTILSLW